MPREAPDALCAVILAAGHGTRLRPLTNVLPKALCPINNVPLLDLALASVSSYATAVAVNVHHRGRDIIDHLADREIRISDETDLLLGSAGALGRLASWIDGRPVLLRNSDAYLSEGLQGLVDGWDGDVVRLLGMRRDGHSDFGDVQYVGACLLPAHVVATLAERPSGLYDLVWRPAWEKGDLEFVQAGGQFVDCGTPREYLRANLIASGGDSVVGPGAEVRGRIDRCVVWPGGVVAEGEVLHDCIRVGSDLTVDAR